MKMTMKRTLIAAALTLSAQMAAALTAEELATTLAAEGYSYISIRDGETQISVRAYKDGAAVSSVYDATTGAVLMTNSVTRDAPLFQSDSVRIREVSRDFVAVAEDGTVTPLGRGPGARPPENRPEGAPEVPAEGAPQPHPEGQPRPERPEGAPEGGEGGGRPPRG